MRAARLSMLVALLASAIGAPARAQFTVNATFDASITGNAQAASIEAVINQARSRYSALYSDPFTANLLFRYSPFAVNGTPLTAGQLARSNYVVYTQASTAFDHELIADAKTANDASAVASLPAVALTPNTEFTSANGRALGLTTLGTMTSTGTVGTGTFDGIVTLNSNAPFDFDRTNGITAGQYDAQRLLEHEIDEVLGLGSILPSTTDVRGNVAMKPEDLFRYAATGARSLSSVGTVSAYFSIDGGATDLIGFNQNANGDYGDWLSPGCATPHAEYAQYAFTCTGGVADISATSPEGIALDVIGYDLVSTSTPEPGTLSLLATALVCAAAFRTRSRRIGRA